MQIYAFTYLPINYIIILHYHFKCLIFNNSEAISCGFLKKTHTFSLFALFDILTDMV